MPLDRGALLARGSLIVWLSEVAMMAWRAAPRTTRGASPTTPD
ncbi:hypothetical protein [Roseomonas chloroacetimidivorans]|jgi:hypothetical protein